MTVHSKQPKNTDSVSFDFGAVTRVNWLYVIVTIPDPVYNLVHHWLMTNYPREYSREFDEMMDRGRRRRIDPDRR